MSSTGPAGPTEDNRRRDELIEDLLADMDGGEAAAVVAEDRQARQMMAGRRAVRERWPGMGLARNRLRCSPNLCFNRHRCAPRHAQHTDHAVARPVQQPAEENPAQEDVQESGVADGENNGRDEFLPVEVASGSDAEAVDAPAAAEAEAERTFAVSGRRIVRGRGRQFTVDRIAGRRHQLLFRRRQEMDRESQAATERESEQSGVMGSDRPSIVSTARRLAAIQEDRRRIYRILEAGPSAGPPPQRPRLARSVSDGPSDWSAVANIHEKTDQPAVTKEKEVDFSQATATIQSLEEMTKKTKALKAELDKKREILRIEREALQVKEKELETFEKEFAEQEKKVKEEKRRLGEVVGLDSSGLIPDCPVCLEPLAAPAQIHNCRNGHLVCGGCRPRLTSCATCRSGDYIGRAIAVEQIVRKAMNLE